jgi:hypothetical protein
MGPFLPTGFSEIGFWLLNVAPFYALGTLVVLWVIAKAIAPLVGVAERIIGWVNGF